MQYSNPWSCSMAGWLISSGFTSDISPSWPRTVAERKKKEETPFLCTALYRIASLPRL